LYAGSVDVVVGSFGSERTVMGTFEIIIILGIGGSIAYAINSRKKPKARTRSQRGIPRATPAATPPRAVTKNTDNRPSKAAEDHAEFEVKLTESDFPDDPDMQSYIAASRHAPDEVNRLIEKAGDFAEDDEPAKALDLYMKALHLSPDSPDDPKFQMNLELNSSIGFAVRGAWVSMELLGRPQADFDEFALLAERKSPETFKALWKQVKAQQAFQAKLEAGDVLLRKILSTFKEGGEVRDLLDELHTLRNEEDKWWFFMEDGKALTKAGLYDPAWRFLNSGLNLAMQRGVDNLPSIYEAMGDHGKKEGKHKNAVRDYLLACKFGVHNGEFPKRAADQVRISLKKAGMKEGSEEFRDELLALVQNAEIRELLDMIDARLND
jgi:hypothetical protein